MYLLTYQVMFQGCYLQDSLLNESDIVDALRKVNLQHLLEQHQLALWPIELSSI